MLDHVSRPRESAHELSPLRVVGISCVTDQDGAIRDIGALWQRAAEAGLLAGSSEAVAVYHAYEVGGGGYRVKVTVGHEVGAGDLPTEGHELALVPAQRGLLIETDGSLDAVREAWGSVWARWPDGGPRAFTADVERWTMGDRGVPVRADVFVGLT